MKNINNFGVKELSKKELKDIDGGWLELLAAAVGLVLAVGEIAEAAGRAYKEQVLDPQYIPCDSSCGGQE
jgi:lactobin A/cerein 7B family class IIb bacteriocin